MRFVCVPACVPAVIAALALAACGGTDGDTTTTPVPSPEDATADADEVDVIEAWAEALAEGDIRAAARFFAIPSVAENGPRLEITSRAEARLFNATLPCGAELVGAESQGKSTVATFELTERPGPGTCGQGVGAEAKTAFVIENGKIVEWRRVPTGRPPPVPSRAS